MEIALIRMQLWVHFILFLFSTYTMQIIYMLWFTPVMSKLCQRSAPARVYFHPLFNHAFITVKIALGLLALREVSLSICTRTFGPFYGGKLLLIIESLRICHLMLMWMYPESSYLIAPVEPLKPRLWDNSEIYLLFSRKQQQIFIICCWHYHIRNQRTRLPH